MSGTIYANYAGAARRTLEKLGTATVAEIAAELGVDDPAIRRALGQGLGAESRKPGGQVERVERGVYRWVGSQTQPAVATQTPDDLLPLINSIDDESFTMCDLDLVARAQDGGFICTDRNGVAWKVNVTATARML